jgi:hypothetical protein
VRRASLARRTLLSLLLIVGAGLAPAPALADGFGWYVYFFDYAELEREMAGELGAAFKPADLGNIDPQFTEAVQGSAFALLGLLEESGRPKLTEPRMHDGELLWANAFLEFGRELQRRNPQSPGRFLVTGRQFLGLGRMPPCRDTDWIHGACGSAILYTPGEVVTLFREVNDLVASPVKWSDPLMQTELLRLRDVLQEAALLKRAIFFYGHD